MSRAETWDSLVTALSKEAALVQALVRCAVDMAAPLSRLDVAAVERHTMKQQSMLAELADAARDRTDALDRCVPGTRSSGRLALQLVISAAPKAVARELRRIHQRLLVLRDEFLLVRARNQLLIQQTLEFTRHFGESLVEAASEPAAYDASGASSHKAASGELFVGAL